MAALAEARAAILREAAKVAFEEVVTPVSDVIGRIRGELNTIAALTQVDVVLQNRLGTK
jgi:hypothetical protein